MRLIRRRRRRRRGAPGTAREDLELVRQRDLEGKPRRRDWLGRGEVAPVPLDVRIGTCRKCRRGIWRSQLIRWCGAARFCWPRCGLCQECQGYGGAGE